MIVGLPESSQCGGCSRLMYPNRAGKGMPYLAPRAAARGLCHPCYDRARTAPRPVRRPVPAFTPRQLVAEYGRLLASGLSRAAVERQIVRLREVAA